MRNTRMSAPRLPWKTTAMVLFALSVCAAQPCCAQIGTPAPPTAQPPPTALPNGVSQIFALQGNNQILAIATPEGYDRLLELIRNLDGDLDILRTKVVSVEARTSDLAAMGVVVSADTALLSPVQNAKLLDVLQKGNLRPVETLRITTRENTPVATLLRHAGARDAHGGTPFTLIPREGKNAALTLEIHEPIAVQVTVESGQTAVVLLPGLTTDTVRLLFLTPSILPSASRPIR